MNDGRTVGRRRRWLQRGVVAALWIVAIVVWQRYRSSNDLSTLDAGQRFLDAVGGAWWGIAAFVGVYALRPLVLFPASVLTVMAGVVFGPWVGTGVVIVAANLSAMVAYGIGRLLGAGALETGPADGDHEGAAAALARRWATRLREHSFETVLTMRLAFLPYDLVNSVCGALRIRWAPFLLATAIGSLPGTISFVLLGASIERIDEGIGGIEPVAVVAGVAILVVSIAVSRVVARRSTPPAADAPPVPAPTIGRTSP